MKSTKVAFRYAKSLLEIAQEQKNVDSVLGDMIFLLQASEDSKDFDMLLTSPIINATKKIEIFEKNFNSVNSYLLEHNFILTDQFQQRSNYFYSNY